jgi:transcriptional regulator with XRE-family HTH domain
MSGALPLTEGRQEGIRVARQKRGTFGKKLVRLRKAAGVSRYALAKRTGLTLQALTYLETSDRVPSWDTVQRVARALGLSTAAFEDEGLVLPEYKPAKRGPKPKKRKGGGK